MRHIYNMAFLMTCHNRREKTLACLKSLYESTIPKNYLFDIFLVDDGSTDGTGEKVKDTYPEVNLIKGDGNLFWNRGMNLAWKTAYEKLHYDFYLWLNDDVVLHNDSIDILLKDFQKYGNHEAIIVGACQSTNEKVTYSGYNNLKKRIKLEPNGTIQQCDYFNGNVVLIPSDVFKQVGFLDPIFHHGQGDFDYGLRAKSKGIKSFVSSNYIGICEQNNKLPVWCNPEYSFTNRWKSFKSPLGGRPKLTFIFQQRHIGLFPAVFHYFTIHLRLIFPWIWDRG